MRTNVAISLFLSVPPVLCAQLSDGYNLPPGWQSPVMDTSVHYLAIIERAEYRSGGDGSAVFDAQGWIGGDYNRLWWKAEAEQETGGPKTGQYELQGLYGRMIAPFWDFVAGLKFDRDYGGSQNHSRGHLAVGLQGTAPFWFELEPTLFLSDDGHLNFELEASYEQLLTQHWIIEARFDLRAAARENHETTTGAGLAGAEFGLRLRHQITRQFAPYGGVEWSYALGETRQMRRTAGEKTSDMYAVVGVRAWF